MMFKSFLIIAMVLPVLAMAQALNTTGWTDTTALVGFDGTDTAYCKVRPLQEYENISIAVAASDPSTAGLGSDSIHLFVGYQLGNTCYNASGKKDTTWRGIFIADSFNNKTAATRKLDSLFIYDADGEPAAKGMIDTSYVSGYAVMIAPVVPTHSELIRAVVIGRAMNNKDAALVARQWYIRRIGQKVQN